METMNNNLLVLLRQIFALKPSYNVCHHYKEIPKTKHVQSFIRLSQLADSLDDESGPSLFEMKRGRGERLWTHKNTDKLNNVDLLNK